MRNGKLYLLGGSRPAARRLICRLAVAAAGAFALPAMAVPPPLAAVDAVQWPAWIEPQGGERRPLRAGETLRPDDRLLTGDGGRALLRLADGSAVKLGENAQLAVGRLDAGRDGVLNAALDVARGAFRFTTGLFKATLPQRDVTIRVATITAGIRGTDVWGKVDQERDLVCLLAGRIRVSHAAVPEPREMDQALTYTAAAKGQAPAAVASVDAGQVARWAAETEVEPGRGIGRVGGRWQVRLGLAESPTEALRLVDQLAALGVPARIKPRRRDGDGYRYDVRVRELASESEAKALAARLAAALKLSGVAVTR